MTTKNPPLQAQASACAYSNNLTLSDFLNSSTAMLMLTLEGGNNVVKRTKNL